MEPVNFAELLAKTDIEIQRLGWTTEQGREHLIKTYGKRSRTLLTYEKLHEFLQYLVSQPTPTLHEVLIAKINFEIERLWWTEEEAWEHLKKTYGKRSRTLLTEVELLDFFQYLVSLPTVEPPTDFDAEYEEFQDFSTYSEESDNVITRISSEDLSQILDKTDVQMQRLGWTTEQGREHLIETYGKRSRTLLTEVELLDFFQYLVSLPTIESPTDFDAEYQEFQDFSTYSEESDKVITRMSSEDLSQILDKTDVEMQRLGWTPEQGREHLIKTYGKRGRFLLTNEELYGFLQYLQSQPDPLAGF
ncbi:hypothetical protein [Nostoc sp.]|uniref:hypothetical protein n=1 Tax=Nostoc sp. TaxID=1180 RepID=UPI002FEF3893